MIRTDRRLRIPATASGPASARVIAPAAPRSTRLSTTASLVRLSVNTRRPSFLTGSKARRLPRCAPSSTRSFRLPAPRDAGGGAPRSGRLDGRGAARHSVRAAATPALELLAQRGLHRRLDMALELQHRHRRRRELFNCGECSRLVAGVGRRVGPVATTAGSERDQRARQGDRRGRTAATPCTADVVAGLATGALSGRRGRCGAHRAFPFDGRDSVRTVSRASASWLLSLEDYFSRCI